MYFKSKKISLLILGITSVVCSRTMFLFFDDPEGPNLLVVTVMAAVLHFSSLAVYAFNPLAKSVFQYPSPSSLMGLKSLLIAISIQIITATVFYLCLN